MTLRIRWKNAPFIALGALALTGCSRHAATPSAKPSEKAKASATPLPISVAVHDLNATIFDRAGVIVATVKASGASAGPGVGAAKSDPIGAATMASAVIYQNGKPTATLDAQTLHADRDARVLVGTGGVVLRSLTQADTPAIRADTMTWKYGEDHLVGKGHVLVTRKPDMRLPGESFVADTQLHTFTLEGDPSAADKTLAPTPAAPSASGSHH